MSRKKILIALGGALTLLGGSAVYYVTTSAEAAAEPEPTMGVIELAPFLANVNDASGRRHTRVEVKLVVSPQERAEEIAADTLAMARLRDRVLILVASKSAAELTSDEGKATLRREILEGAGPIVAPGTVREALFGELIVQ